MVRTALLRVVVLVTFHSVHSFGLMVVGPGARIPPVPELSFPIFAGIVSVRDLAVTVQEHAALTESQKIVFSEFGVKRDGNDGFSAAARRNEFSSDRVYVSPEVRRVFKGFAVENSHRFAFEDLGRRSPVVLALDEHAANIRGRPCLA